MKRLLILFLLGGTLPLAAQGRFALESGMTVGHMNDDTQWASAVDVRAAFDVSRATRVVWGVSRWFDPFDTNGNYSWGGIGTDLGAQVHLAAAGPVAVRLHAVAHASVGDDGDGTLRVHAGPVVGLRLEGAVVGPLAWYVGAAGQAFIANSRGTSGRFDPGVRADGGVRVRL